MTTTSTFALPLMSSHEQLGHGRTLSKTRSYQRHRASSRLAPPFPLPRIPSERLVLPQDFPETSELHDVEIHSHDHSHDVFSTSNTDLYRANQSTPNADLHTHQSLHSANPLPPSVSIFDNKESHSYGYPIEKSGHTKTHVDAHTHVHHEKPKHKANQHTSMPTKIMLRWTEDYPLLHGILVQKDTRRIFYFMLLNLAFMVIQSAYGFLTGSLGLISDSIHMFFDCIALGMGICATVMAKWAPSVKFPYGYGKIDTLAGFANGVFLMLISVEITYEAVERLAEGSDISRTTELLVVSGLGLAVNLVGIFAFEHGHAHGHGHSHAGHDHGSENMHGIYLHIMADALGSLAVVVSTLLVRFTGWSGFDPLASCMIAILIFASAIPLVYSTATNLLLSLDSDIEYNLRDILAGISGLRGVVGYSVPKFWLDSTGKEGDHDHDHDHDHHDHDQHDHGHSHSNAHGHDHHDHHSHNDHHHDSSANQDDAHHANSAAILGVIHVIASQHADIQDVRHRTSQYLRTKNMNILVQVEREGEGRCWCGGGLRSG